MNYERYDLETYLNATTFEFTSVGKQGSVIKVVMFSETDNSEVYNLGFGDKNEETQEIDDLKVTNNGDTDKVLATVASTVYAFTNQYPDFYVYASGSTKARTRLYRMGISKNYDEISKDFHIWGEFEGNWHIFDKKTDYDAFLVKRKK